MKTLTVCQPWAAAIIHGTKRVENRTRKTNYRGPLAIHAGKSREWEKDFRSQWMNKIYVGWDENRLFEHLNCVMTFGAVIGTVELIDCVRFEDLSDWKGDAGERVFACGPWCWIFANVRALAIPVPWRGRLGFFDVPDEIISGEIEIAKRASPTAAVP